MLIKPLLINALEAALNRYLTLDTQLETKLTPLVGKIIAVTIEPFNETIYLSPSDNRILCLENFLGQPDTRISGSLAALGLIGVSARPMRAIFSGQVKIEGDTQAGRKFQELFAKLDVDLERHLAKYTGAALAHRFGNFFRTINHWSQDSLTTLKLNTSELLQEETRDLPAPAEADIFYRQVDTLRNDFDRLQARVQRLQQFLVKKPCS